VWPCSHKAASINVNATSEQYTLGRLRPGLSLQWLKDRPLDMNNLPRTWRQVLTQAKAAYARLHDLQQGLLKLLDRIRYGYASGEPS
jgi:hypothetical protein